MAAAGGKTTRFRWLYVARCAVASVVTVLAVVIIVRAVVVMLRPEKLQLKVTGGYVSVGRIPSMPPPEVTFVFTLRAFNPSGRAFIDYTNVTVRLVSNNASSAAAKIAQFDLPQSISVSQQMAHEAHVNVSLTPEEDVPLRYVQALFDGGSVSAEMEVDGLLTSHTMKGISRHDIPTTYYCWPVTIAVGGASSSLSDYSSDTSCLDKSDAPAFV